jgi:hypothetical protein
MPEKNKNSNDRKKRLSLFQRLAAWWFQQFPPLN